MSDFDFPACCTATGVQLAKRLSRLIPDLLDGSIPASIGRPLAAAIDAADRKQARMRALEGAVGILAAGQHQSTYQLSRALAAALLRFQRAKKRIDAGHRAPSELEKHLAIIAATGCQSWRKLFDEIREICPRDGKR